MRTDKLAFIALADAIREWNHNPPRNFKGEPCEQFTQLQLACLADFCASQNPNFMRERWLGYIAGTNGKNEGAR